MKFPRRQFKKLKAVAYNEIERLFPNTKALQRVITLVLVCGIFEATGQSGMINTMALREIDTSGTSGRNIGRDYIYIHARKLTAVSSHDLMEQHRTQNITVQEATTTEGSQDSSKSKGGSGVSGSANRQGAKPLSTKNLSKSQLAMRYIAFVGFMTVSTAVLVILAVWLAYKKSGKLEVPYIKLNGCYDMPTVENYDLVLLVRRLQESCAPYSQVELSERSLSVVKVNEFEGRLSIEAHDQSLVDSEAGLYEAEPNEAVQSNEELQRQELETKHELDEDDALRRAAEIEEALRKDEARQQRVAAWKQTRFYIQFFLFIMYVLVCTFLPIYNRDKVSCNGGFFWEDHMPFYATFYITKLAELWLYARDESLTGELKMWKFVLIFVPSFLGYSDGYQDNTATQIARACSMDADAPVNHALAGTLSLTMTYSFWVGVVFFQWTCLGLLAVFKDDSLVVLAKLVHMDALALCIDVPNELLWMLYAVSAVRTFGEDVPQGGLQSFYVVHVKYNPFMIVSICFSVGCSVKAFLDAIKRSAEAIGRLEFLLHQTEAAAAVDAEKEAAEAAAKEEEENAKAEAAQKEAEEAAAKEQEETEKIAKAEAARKEAEEAAAKEQEEKEEIAKAEAARKEAEEIAAQKNTEAAKAAVARKKQIEEEKKQIAEAKQKEREAKEKREEELEAIRKNAEEKREALRKQQIDENERRRKEAEEATGRRAKLQEKLDAATAQYEKEKGKRFNGKKIKDAEVAMTNAKQELEAIRLQDEERKDEEEKIKIRIMQEEETVREEEKNELVRHIAIAQMEKDQEQRLKFMEERAAEAFREATGVVAQSKAQPPSSLMAVPSKAQSKARPPSGPKAAQSKAKEKAVPSSPPIAVQSEAKEKAVPSSSSIVV